FLRDLREGRKSVPFLLRRGWRLMRAERSIVARQVALGAHPCGRDEALDRLAAAAAAGRQARARTAAGTGGVRHTDAGDMRAVRALHGVRPRMHAEAGLEGPPGPPAPPPCGAPPTFPRGRFPRAPRTSP